MMIIEALVFDCDGTLLDTNEIKRAGFYYAATLFGEEAASALAELHASNTGMHRNDKFAWLFRQIHGREITAAESDELYRRFKDFIREPLLQAKPIPGAFECLEEWYGKIPLYVASTAPQDELENILEHNNISRYFAGIFGSPPGKREVLRKAVQHAGASSLSTVLVGDSLTDLDAAETLGTLFYGIGPTLKNSGHPWHDDLTQFNSWLKGELQR